MRRYYVILFCIIIFGATILAVKHVTRVHEKHFAPSLGRVR